MVPWRNRLRCITADLYKKAVSPDYFCLRKVFTAMSHAPYLVPAIALLMLGPARSAWPISGNKTICKQCQVLPLPAEIFTLWEHQAQCYITVLCAFCKRVHGFSLPFPFLLAKISPISTLVASEMFPCERCFIHSTIHLVVA